MDSYRVVGSQRRKSLFAIKLQSHLQLKSLVRERKYPLSSRYIFISRDELRDLTNADNFASILCFRIYSNVTLVNQSPFVRAVGQLHARSRFTAKG